jgi:hypothetical protein
MTKKQYSKKEEYGPTYGSSIDEYALQELASERGNNPGNVTQADVDARVAEWTGKAN